MEYGEMYYQNFAEYPK